MLDRFGNKVALGWSHSETLWVVAAMSLGGEDRKAAYRDISDMRGCSYYAVLDKAKRIALARSEEINKARVLSGTVMVASGVKPVCRLAPSLLRQPSKAQLMGGR